MKIEVLRTNLDQGRPSFETYSLLEAVSFAVSCGWECVVMDGDRVLFSYGPISGAHARTVAAREALKEYREKVYPIMRETKPASPRYAEPSSSIADRVRSACAAGKA